MIILVEMAEGQTEPIDFDLPLDSAVTEDLTGSTIEFVFRDKNGNAKTSAAMGSAIVSNGPTRRVRFTPTADGLKASESPYWFRVKVTSPDSKVYHHPHDQALRWAVFV